jgi:type I restriction enzyme, S subunit
VTHKGSVTLNDVCEFIVDCLHKTAPIQAEGYPSIRTPNVGRGRLILEGVNRVSQDTYDEWTRRAVPVAGDLILAREAPAGNVAVIKEGQTVCLGQRTVHLRPDGNKVDSDFLCYFLLAPKQQGALLAGETGATAGHVNMRDIRRLDLGVLPEKHRQKKAGEIISAYDDLIENNRRRMELLEEAARMLYREWFIHFRFPGHEHVKSINGIPEGWERRTLGSIAKTNCQSYGVKELPEEINYIDISSVASGKVVARTTMSAANAPGRARRKAQDGDIIWSNVRPNLRAYALILEPAENDVFSTGFTVLTASAVPYTWLFQFVTTENFVGHLVKHATGVGYPAVRPDDFERAVAIVPSERLLKLFHEATEANMRMISKLNAHSERLAQARDLLLPKLMNGEIAV